MKSFDPIVLPSSNIVWESLTTDGDDDICKRLISLGISLCEGKMNTKTTTSLVAILAIATITILVSSTAVAKPALASSSRHDDNNHDHGNSVSKSDIRDTGKFLQCIANHGGNDISKSKAQKCVDNYLG